MEKVEELETLEMGMESSFLSEESDKLNKDRERRRRVSVSAVPSRIMNLNSYTMPVYPKSEDVARALRSVLGCLFIFQEVKGKDLDGLVEAFQEMNVGEGEVIIRQGEDGDNFYVVSEGCANIYVKPKAKGAERSAGPAATDDEGESDGALVLNVGAGGYFGELALMHRCPRAATVKAATGMRLFAIDNLTFTSILRLAGGRRREDYLAFLLQVPILSGLSDQDRGKVADVLLTATHEPGEYIIRQGDTNADLFYLLYEGCASIEVTSQRGADMSFKRTVSVSVSKATYERGDYFGELALLRKAPRSASVIAVEKCTTVSIDRAAFLRLLGPLLESLIDRSDSYMEITTEVLQELRSMKRQR